MILNSSRSVRWARLVKHNRLLAVQQYAIVDMPAHAAREYDLFQVAPLLDQVFHGIAVGDSYDVLLNDGAIVEYFGNIVAGGSDQFHPALERLVIGLRADECRQEGVVDVDDAMREARDEFVRQYLHVPRQHGEVSIMLADERDLLLFRFALVLFGYGNDEERNLIKVRERLIVGVVRNDQRDIAVQFPDFVAIQQIDRAMVVLRNQDCHLLALAGLRQTPIHVELLGNRAELLGDLREWDVEIGGVKLHAHQEPRRLCVGVFVRVQDI